MGFLNRITSYMLGAALAGALALLPWGSAQDELAADIHEATLENGLRVIMVVRDLAPVIDFNLTFDVGGVDEPPGLGGIAHMVEHMAFKGTRSIGSRDIAAEEDALRALERAANALKVAREAGAQGDALARFEADFAEAQAAAQALASPNALDTLFTDNGAQGLNASTGYDRTSYTVSLPANRLELYARVYADVLSNPVFRSFYEERDVVREERRGRSEDSPDGVLSEAFLAAAFQEHPYGRPLIGDAEEIAGSPRPRRGASSTSSITPTGRCWCSSGTSIPSATWRPCGATSSSSRAGPKCAPNRPPNPRRRPNGAFR
jgi:predicted Zn-dependent peptidase